MPANAIDMLTEDHKQVQVMFQEFERSTPDQRDRLVHEIIQSLGTHSRIEEQVLYPFIRAEVPDGDQLMDDDPSFEEAFHTLREGVEHHVEEEEGQVFPKLAEAADEATLAELGQRMAQARALSPREDRPGE